MQLHCFEFIIITSCLSKICFFYYYYFSRLSRTWSCTHTHTFICHLPYLSGWLFCVSYYQHILILPACNNNMAGTQTAEDTTPSWTAHTVSVSVLCSCTGVVFRFYCLSEVKVHNPHIKIWVLKIPLVPSSGMFTIPFNTFDTWGLVLQPNKHRWYLMYLVGWWEAWMWQWWCMGPLWRRMEGHSSWIYEARLDVCLPEHWSPLPCKERKKGKVMMS